MQGIIVYGTKYGCTARVAKMLAEEISDQVDLINLVENKGQGLDLTKYDFVVVGGSIYAGNIQKEVSDFCSQNLNLLKQRRLGLFICCGLSDKAEEQLHSSFAKQLLDQAVFKGDLGYEFNFEKMNFLSRLIVKSLAKKKESESAIKKDKIQEFAEILKTGINPNKNIRGEK